MREIQQRKHDFFEINNKSATVQLVSVPHQDMVCGIIHWSLLYITLNECLLMQPHERDDELCPGIISHLVN